MSWSMRIGQGGEGSCFLHNPRYDFNDEILPLGSALMPDSTEQAMPIVHLDASVPEENPMSSAHARCCAACAGSGVARRRRCASPIRATSPSMDPHSLNESLQLSFTGNVYEPLVGRGKDLSLVPALATKWKQTSPDRVALRTAPGRAIPRRHAVHRRRRGLQLQARRGRRLRHEGLHRAPIKEVRKVGDHAVEIETTAPFPILPDS